MKTTATVIPESNLDSAPVERLPSGATLTLIEAGHARPDLSFVSQLPKVRYPMRLKLTLPYIVLALGFAAAGAYVTSQIMVDTLEERFTNQLIEAGKLSADQMVLEEEERLTTLRLISNTEGVADALVAKDVERLRQIVWPLAGNAREEAVDIIDLSGTCVLSLRHDFNDSIQNYSFTSGDTTFKLASYVQNVLAQISQDNQDKFPSVITVGGKPYFYIAGPIIDKNGRMVGVVQVGRQLDTLVRELRATTLSQTSIYDLQGRILATTLPRIPDNPLTLQQTTRETAIQAQGKTGIVHDFQLASINYTELVGMWQARGNQSLGLLGIALPQTFLAHTSQLTRLQVFGLVFVGLLLVLVAGIYLARRITRPLMKVVSASAQAAGGNLDVTVDPVGNDEIAVLAHAFNQMMVGLKESTARRVHEIELLQELQHERELRELKSRFVSMVSHEFKTPLTTILSSSDFVRTYGPSLSEDKKQKHFKRIESAVSVMKQLVDDVLLIGKTDVGRFEFVPVDVDLHQFCESVIDEIRPLLSTEHPLHFSANSDAVHFSADPKLLRLLFTNLLTNAVKYSPHGGAIWFSVDANGTNLIFSIKDQGIGIPEKDQKHIFETFHRAQNVGNLSGTGLGLYIARMVTDLHSGTIRFESQENHGTEFFVSIPIVSTVYQEA